MESSIITITSLYNSYKNSPNIISKLNNYINVNLPILLKKYDEEEKKKSFLEIESNRYINDFLTSPDRQYFYISATDIFIEYKGEHYTNINEDDLWMLILSDITKNEILVENKQKIKNTIIQKIKENDIKNTIPESYTVQYVINFFTPTLFDTKEDVKHLMAIIGDNVLNKQTDLYYFVPIESKPFFDTLETLCQYYFRSKLNITSSIRYRYRNEDYSKSRIIYFTKSIKNKSCWLSFLKDNLFNLLVVSCHYSTRYINADSYVNKRNTNFKKKIFYLKNNTKDKLIDEFIENMIIKETNCKISFNDMYFLWKIYLKNRNIPNTVLKTEFEEIIKSKLENINNIFKNCQSNFLANVKIFKKFWSETIQRDFNNEIEISELHTLMIKWISDNNKSSNNFSEENLQDMIEYFYDDIGIGNDKFLSGIKCNLWDKLGDMKEAFDNKFNKKFDKNLKIYDAYVMYCKYANNNGKLLTVSKSYFYNFLENIVPNNFIQNGCILQSYWDN